MLLTSFRLVKYRCIKSITLPRYTRYVKVSSIIGIVSAIMIVIGIIALAIPLLSLAGVRISTSQQLYAAGCCSVTIPVTVSNYGLLPLNDINLSVTGYVNNLSVHGGGFAQSIPAGHASLLNITIALPEEPELLFQSGTMNITAYLTGKVSSLIGLSAKANLSMPWQAPLQSLAIGKPQFTLTSVPSIVIPYSFSDASPYIPITGELVVNLTSNGANIGYGASAVDAQPGSTFSGNMLVNITGVTIKSLLTNSADMNYSVFFLYQGRSIQVYNSSYHWGAPLSNMSIGNITYSLQGSGIEASIPVYFEDLSSISLNTEMSASLIISGNYYNSTQMAYMIRPGANNLTFNISFPVTNNKPSELLLSITVQGIHITYSFLLGG